MMSTTNITLFANIQLVLLAHELELEIAETSSHAKNLDPRRMQRAGLAITNLVLGAQRTGLGGKPVVELVCDPAVAKSRSGGGWEGEEDGEAGLLIESGGVKVGDLVRVCVQVAGGRRRVGGSKGKRVGWGKGGEGERQGEEWIGVVTRVGRLALWIAVGAHDGDIGEDGSVAAAAAAGKRLCAVKLANEVTYKRMNSTMRRLAKMREDEYSALLRISFGLTALTPVGCVDGLEWTDSGLNESQKEAVKFALGSAEVALIHGPPGVSSEVIIIYGQRVKVDQTGKTHTLIELILQLLKRKLRVLVCGPSNISVDNIIERLARHKIPMVRLGHPARLLPSVLDHSLDVLTETSDAAAIVRDVRREMDSKQASIQKTKNGRERRQIYVELKGLRKEYREREKKVVGTLLGASRVVLATLHGAGGFNMRDEAFDVVVIDEASQALEAQCWIPLLHAKKVVLAGDHLQLPPTIRSRHVAGLKRIGEDGKEISIPSSATLATTLFDRLLQLHGPGLKRMLTTQYRMHEKIMRFPSDELYDSKLVAADSVAARLLSNLPYKVRETEDTVEPLIFFDTQGGDFPEKSDEEGDREGFKRGLVSESKSNEMEAALVRLHVENLVNAGVRAEDIAVITPYNSQLALISRSMKESFPSLELGSVDGFQGREKEAVIVSLVRSNPQHEVGFLGEERRLNVAMTRPRRSLTIIGDSETLQSQPFLKRWMDFLEKHSDLRYPSVTSLNAR